MLVDSTIEDNLVWEVQLQQQLQLEFHLYLSLVEGSQFRLSSEILRRKS